MFETFLSNDSHTALISTPFLCAQKKVGNMKKVFEKIIEGILACSGFVTSLTIVLIVLFLFSEAVGLFHSRVIEEGYVLALNKDNKVSELTPVQIKDVFDEEITNWREVGGENLPIRLFRLEDVTRYYTEEQLGAFYENVGACITDLVERTPGIVAFVPQQFIGSSGAVRLLPDNTISLKDVFAGAEWFPTATPAPQFGFLPLITGTLWVSLFAILIALPFGLAVAVYMSEVANHKIRNLMKPIIELLSGIPSVVYGFFGLIVIVPFLQKVFDLPVGESGLAGSIVLAIMALPTIITVTEDAMQKVYEEVQELEQAVRENGEIEEEFGDILFALVDISRFLKINPEFALTKAIKKFINRFEYIEKSALSEGKALSEMSLEEMDLLWDEAKIKLNPMQ